MNCDVLQPTWVSLSKSAPAAVAAVMRCPHAGLCSSSHRRPPQLKRALASLCRSTRKEVERAVVGGSGSLAATLKLLPGS